MDSTSFEGKRQKVVPEDTRDQFRYIDILGGALLEFAWGTFQCNFLFAGEEASAHRARREADFIEN
jgi:hypothetical protein